MRSNKREKSPPCNGQKAAESYRDVAKKTPSARDAWREVELLEGFEENPRPEPSQEDNIEEAKDCEQIPA